MYFLSSGVKGLSENKVTPSLRGSSHIYKSSNESNM